MFTIDLKLRAGTKSAVAAGPRRALWQPREYRNHYGVEPTVRDENRSYTEAELQEMVDAGVDQLGSDRSN